MKPILIRGARQLITLHGSVNPRRGAALNQLNIIEDGAMLIEGAVIREVGPSRRVENLAAARNAREINAAGRVVMPGLIDCHAHLMSGHHSEFIHPGGPLPAPVRAVLNNLKGVRESTGVRLRADADVVVRGATTHGTTSMDAKTGYALNESGELKSLRALFNVNQQASIELTPSVFAGHTLPPEFEGRPDQYIERVCSHLLPVVRRRKLAGFAEIVCGPGGFTLEQAGRFLACAQDSGFQTRVHTSQYAHQRDSVALAIRMGAHTVERLDYATDQDAIALAQSSSIAVLTPAATFFLGEEHYAPARTLIEHGVAVAIGSGYSRVTCPCYNLQMSLFLACHRLGMTAAEAISAATINAAHALGIAARTGSLETGKQADLLLLSVPDYRELTLQFGINLVSMTMKRGQVVDENAGKR